MVDDFKLENERLKRELDLIKQYVYEFKVLSEKIKKHIEEEDAVWGNIKTNTQTINKMSEDLSELSRVIDDLSNKINEFEPQIKRGAILDDAVETGVTLGKSIKTLLVFAGTTLAFISFIIVGLRIIFNYGPESINLFIKWVSSLGVIAG